jgi:hypothetical protein
MEQDGIISPEDQMREALLEFNPEITRDWHSITAVIVCQDTDQNRIKIFNALKKIKVTYQYRFANKSSKNIDYVFQTPWSMPAVVRMTNAG